tara:strand:- start:1114 stop:1485 length:372 start_codon:yes stop_codon:yes gene_type:complete
MQKFYKSQIVSLIATATDFLITISLKEIAGFPYLSAHMVGITAGGASQFTLNKIWAFKKGKNISNRMIIKFILVWVVGFSLNTSGVWLLTHSFHWNYILSKIIISSVLAVSLNFYFQKEYVFK